MTELYINNQRCSLKNGFSCKINKTNIFTNEETNHTLDIDVDLKDGENSILFKHISRFNTSKKIDTMEARLVVDNVVMIEGSVFLLQINDTSIKIQIVGEGSSFSYKSEDSTDKDGKIKLGELELGMIQNRKITSSDAYLSLYGEYPKNNYVCLPTLKTYARRCVLNSNQAVSVWDGIENCVLPDDLKTWVSDRDKIGHPYLLFVIDSVCKALGYKISKNDLLENEQAKRELLITGLSSLYLRDHVPQWTVAKFFREVEKHFNVLFLFNKISKTVTINSFKIQMESGKMAYISDVIDEKTVEFNKEPEQQERNFSDVRYNFPDGYSFYKEADFEDNMEEMCTIKEITNPNDCASFDSLVINKLNDVQLVRRRESTTSAEQGFYEYIVPVNMFRHRGDVTGDNAMELDIVPCMYTIGHAKFCKTADGTIIKSAYKVPVVVACNDINIGSSEPSAKQGMDDLIENGVNEKEEEKVASQIFVAVYNGVQPQLFKLQNYEHTFIYPEIAVPLMVDTPEDNPLLGAKQIYQKEQRFGLALSGDRSIHHQYYASAFLIDMTEKYKIKFLSKKIIEPNEICWISGRKMFPNNIEYTVSNGGLDNNIECECYNIE